MSRPTKKEKQYRINEDIVNDIRNNPDKAEFNLQMQQNSD